MRIDFHGHLFTEWKGMHGMSPAALIAEMDDNGIAQTVVFTLNGFWDDFAAANEELHELTQAHRDRLPPFGTVHPYQPEKAIREMHRCRDEFGMQGIKLHPWLQGFSITSAEMIAVAECADELGLILVFHDGTPPYCEPFQIAHLAHCFPELRIVLGHGGLKDFYLEAILALRRYPNVYLGTALPAPVLKQTCLEMDGERILFGSDVAFGAFSQKFYLETIRCLHLPERITDKVLGGNALALLGS